MTHIRFWSLAACFIPTICISASTVRTTKDTSFALAPGNSDRKYSLKDSVYMDNASAIAI